MEKDFSAKITKKVVLDYCNGNAYSDAFKTYLVYGKIYNADKTRYRLFKFISTVYKDSLFEYDEYPEKMSLTRQEEITNIFISSYLDYINGYNDARLFFEICNDSIKNYNASIKNF